ncbi:hypothetical protein RSSM_03721 [Rhodopirellula sallentina SM41]|uniref:Uncharacterized protein n=1 Tax=Rhodopirellula sallentina SM41 TaxID=1263870 RepID=M5U054_9BACT|nr:hypothetical protein RSSM_03721 [Rhodopirellula sallentina SM41]
MAKGSEKSFASHANRRHVQRGCEGRHDRRVDTRQGDMLDSATDIQNAMAARS